MGCRHLPLKPRYYKEHTVSGFVLDYVIVLYRTNVYHDEDMTTDLSKSQTNGLGGRGSVSQTVSHSERQMC